MKTEALIDSNIKTEKVKCVTQPQPKVSIVLYTVKGKGVSYLAEALECCLKQTYQNFELIIVNDCAGAKADKILKKLKDSRIKVIQNSKTKGLGASLNNGLAQATGDYLTWIKDIDLLKPTAIEDMATLLKEEREIDLVFAHYYKHSMETNEDMLVYYADNIKLPLRKDFSPCILFTRKLKEKVGAFKADYMMAADYDYLIRISHQFKMKRVPKPLSTRADVLYYARRIDRIYGYLFKRWITYQNDLTNIINLERSIWDFKDRLNKYAGNKLKYFYLLWQAVFKFYRISFKDGLFFQYMFFTNRKFRNKIEEIIDRLKKKWELFCIGRTLKVTTNGPNILCIVPEAVVGGCEKVVMDVAARLEKENLNFHILLTEGEENEWVTKFLNTFKSVILLKREFKLWHHDYDKNYYRYIHYAIKKLKIDVLMVTNCTAPYGCLQKLKNDFPKLKMVDVLHTAIDYGAVGNEILPYAKYLDQRVCISYGLKEYMLRKYENHEIDPKLNEKISVIHNGNDMHYFQKEEALKGKFKDKYNINEDTKIISFIGRFSREKRAVMFVDIAKRVLDNAKDKNIKFVMAGEGPFLNQINKRIKDLGLEKHIVLTGMISGEEIKELLTDTYLVLMLSWIEGLPLVIIESMAMEVPVISTNVGSIDESIEDGKNGYLLHPFKNIVENFSEKILTLLSSEDLYNRLAEDARSTVMGEYSMVAFAKRYREMFSSLLSNNKTNAKEVLQESSENTNDGTYWDNYVKDWEQEPATQDLKYLGSEWGGEEEFFSLLEKYANKDARALEIGCGGGRVTSQGVKLLKHVCASDVSKEMLRICKDSVPEKNVSYHQLDGFTLNEFKDSTMDFVYSHDVFVHFSSLQLYPYFKEIKRVLKPGGKAIISFYKFETAFEHFKELSLKYNEERRFPPHMREHFVTEEMINVMIKDLSLEVVEVDKKRFLIVVFQK